MNQTVSFSSSRTLRDVCCAVMYRSSASFTCDTEPEPFIDHGGARPSTGPHRSVLGQATVSASGVSTFSLSAFLKARTMTRASARLTLPMAAMTGAGATSAASAES